MAAELGVRWDDYRSTLDVPTYTLSGVTTAAVQRRESQLHKLQAGLVYKPSANSSIYGSYGTSSTPPGNDAGDGLDGLTVAVQNLAPQDSKNYELGTKWEVLPGGRLSLSAAVFRSEMNNARVTAPDGTTQNVGKKTMKGVELGISGSITRVASVRRLHLSGWPCGRQRLRQHRHHCQAGVHRVAIQRQRIPDYAEEQRIAVDLVRGAAGYAGGRW
jgi:outer membrane receptor for monomeric catechols